MNIFCIVFYGFLTLTGSLSIAPSFAYAGSEAVFDQSNGQDENTGKVLKPNAVQSSADASVENQLRAVPGSPLPTPVPFSSSVSLLEGNGNQSQVPLPLPANARSVSLEEAYRYALGRNEEVGIQEEQVKQAEERFKQARSALLPNVNFIGTYLKQESPPPGTASSISPSEQKVYKINATQPLFHGFREWTGLTQQGNLRDATEFNRQEALTNIFLDIAQSFYQVLLATENLRELEREKKLNDKRLGEFKRFQNLGRNRQSDVLSLQASIATLDAQLEATRAAILNAKSAFSILTGIDRDVTLVDREMYPTLLSPVENYLSMIDQRPDVLALKKTMEANQNGVDFAREGHLPSLDLGGNYYFQRPGYLANVNWDVQLTLTFPIFQGGYVLSQVRQATSLEKQSSLAYERAKRVAHDAIENLYIQIQSDLRQVMFQKTAAELSEKNYQAEVRDYRLGLVTNIEVLQAQTNEQDALRAYNQTQYQFKTDYLKLLGAVAERPRKQSNQ